MARSLALMLMLPALPALAGQVEIIDATARASGGAWTFNVTLRHGDTGWDHYADAWRVLGPDGAVLGTRTLHHPHETEQPFTRSLSGVRIPDAVRKVRIEAHDKVHGWSPTQLTVAIPVP
ncbi:MAG: hypothetical protein ACJAVR_000501 [Paracoccaceae bacterium]|jgi:hypothetical protein